MKKIVLLSQIIFAFLLIGCISQQEDSNPVAAIITPPQTQNTAPIISVFSVTPTQGVAPLLISFSATANDQDGDSLTYAWEFGDSLRSVGMSGTHRFTATGMYTVRVTVSDGKGGVATKDIAVLVTNSAIVIPPLSLVLTANPPNITQGQNSVLSASVSGGITPYKYEWSTGASTNSIVVGPSQTTTYQVRVVGADSNSVSASVTISVTPVIPLINNPPQITSFVVTPTRGVIPDTVYYSGSATDADNDSLSYLVDFGDGTLLTTKTGMHVYAQAGVYTVHFSVSDGRGGNDSRYVAVVADAVPPSPGVSAIWSVDMNMTLRQTPSPSWRQTVQMNNPRGITYLWVNYQMDCDSLARPQVGVAVTDASGKLFNFSLPYTGNPAPQWAVLGNSAMDLPANCIMTFMFQGQSPALIRISGVKGTQ